MNKIIKNSVLLIASIVFVFPLTTFAAQWNPTPWNTMVNYPGRELRMNISRIAFAIFSSIIPNNKPVLSKPQVLPSMVKPTSVPSLTAVQTPIPTPIPTSMPTPTPAPTTTVTPSTIVYSDYSIEKNKKISRKSGSSIVETVKPKIVTLASTSTSDIILSAEYLGAGEELGSFFYTIRATSTDTRAHLIKLSLICPEKTDAIMKQAGGCNDNGYVTNGNTAKWFGMFINFTTDKKIITVLAESFDSNKVILSSATTSITLLPGKEIKPTMIVTYPQAGFKLENGFKDDWASGGRIAIIKWTISGDMGPSIINIDLVDENEVFVKSIAKSIPNTGVYDWKYDQSIKSGNYNIIIQTYSTRDSSNIKASSGVFKIESNNDEKKSDISVSLIDASSDKAGYWDKFSPGVGNGNKTKYDWHWISTINTPIERVVSSITIQHGHEGWSTAVTTVLGVKAYPLVVLKNGTQLNDAYDQKLTLTTGINTLDLYGQIESSSFLGGVLKIVFMDGEIVEVPIKAANPPRPVTAPLSSSIMVISPNGGETFKVGEKMNITWSTKNINQDYVYISLENKALTYSHYVSMEKISDNGQYTWTIPDSMPSDEYKVRIYCSEKGQEYCTNDGQYGQDFSDATFIIATSTPIVVPVPMTDTQIVTNIVQIIRNHICGLGNCDPNFDFNSDGKTGAHESLVMTQILTTDDASFNNAYKDIQQAITDRIGLKTGEKLFESGFDTDRDGEITNIDKERISKVMIGERVYPTVVVTN